MENKAARFVEETRETVDRWKERVAKADVSRLKFDERYGYLIAAYDQTMDEVSGVQKRRRFVSAADLESGRVPIDAWNSLPAIPGPSPGWFKSTIKWNSSASIGRGIERSSNLINLDFKISNAGRPSLKKGNIFNTLGWPVGSVE